MASLFIMTATRTTEVGSNKTTDTVEKAFPKQGLAHKALSALTKEGYDGSVRLASFKKKGSDNKTISSKALMSALFNREYASLVESDKVTKEATGTAKGKKLAQKQAELKAPRKVLTPTKFKGIKPINPPSTVTAQAAA